MFTSRADAYSQARQAFAEQFEDAGSGFIYRKSQKGEAIRVTAGEYSRFADEFDRDLGRAKWIIWVGLTVVLGGIVLLSELQGSELSQSYLVVGMAVVMIPYFLYHRWAWGKPARKLAGRTPIAGARTAEEVKRLRFKRMTYRQLAGAAFAGAIVPFVGSSGHDPFSGWRPTVVGNWRWGYFIRGCTSVAQVALRTGRIRQELNPPFDKLEYHSA